MTKIERKAASKNRTLTRRASRAGKHKRALQEKVYAMNFLAYNRWFGEVVL